MCANINLMIKIEKRALIKKINSSYVRGTQKNNFITF